MSLRRFIRKKWSQFIVQQAVRLPIGTRHGLKQLIHYIEVHGVDTKDVLVVVTPENDIVMSVPASPDEAATQGN